VATGLVFGLAPALQASRLDLQTLLNREGSGAGRRTAGWLRGTLIGVQVAVCTVLLIAAGLLFARTICRRDRRAWLRLSQRRGRVLRSPWAGLSGSLSLLALLLASVGVYGVVSYVVSRRLREVVIRMVLGASERDVQTLRPVAIGAVIGIGTGAAASQILNSVLFGVSPFDPIAFIGAPLFLFGVAAAASLLPTRRALTVDAMTPLRYE
jgi:ABC-type antimicrobial peptide transport system permease subunit